MKIFIAGDFCPKYRIAELLEQGKFEEMLGEVKPIIEQADYSIVNFECPVVNGKGNPIPKCGLNLRTTAKAVDLIKYAGFKAVTLANNHFLDYGKEGVHDTLEALDNAGIAHVGGGMNLSEASKTMYIKGDAGKVAIINCCEHEFSIASETTAGSNPLNPVQQWYAIQEARKQANFVIVIVHGGHEHYQLPSPRMQELYRYFIDCGADAVVNHHQHCFSGYEEYKGKPIFYGLGNFYFDDPDGRKRKWNKGFMLLFEIKKGEQSFQLLPYNQCDDIPTVVMETDETSFHSTIDDLNKIIADELRLRESHENWMDKSSDYYKILFSPYNNRIFQSACSRGFIPSLLSSKKLAAILNHVNCEAHRDRLIYFLNSFVRQI